MRDRAPSTIAATTCFIQTHSTNLIALCVAGVAVAAYVTLIARGRCRRAVTVDVFPCIIR